MSRRFHRLGVPRVNTLYAPDDPRDGAFDELEVPSSDKFPTRPSGFAARWALVWKTAPQNAAYEAHVAATADMSERRTFRMDEQVHAFARSRSSNDNVMSTYRAEGLVAPIHQQMGPNAHLPTNNGVLSVSDRAAYYDTVAPVYGRRARAPARR
jgi:hypothetical protein